jgi:hypothetical protein
MKHLVVVLVDTDTQFPKVKISHHKAIVFDPSNREEMEKLIVNDINTLLTGLIFAIRKGGEEGLLNKVATIENAITYLRNSVSSIELVQEVHSGLLDPKAMENIVR